ncbi:protein NUCLEAR FUSION DEFECTIVE 4-like [Zingiber officinale]|uniref:protein NUCLEAR FUSION DEFECTIVE 4-like n=1 Tax=Zingiber officinale TaxID=94328 RepID=UPI001C4D778F|nr:protein NUCLEAR FUSION DEFECTIVE 4-like [Zingiber officinale]
MARAVTPGSRQPWLGFAASVLVQVAGGTGYTFPLYSHSLKKAMGYKQRQITLLGVANDFGENFGIIAGLLCNRFPPWSILLVGATCCFLGFGALWSAVSLTFPNLHYCLLWLALCIATNSSAWFGTGVIVTNLRNFPHRRGTVAGILKGYAGLGGAVYTILYTGVLHGSSTKLLWFMAVGVPIVSLATMFFVRPFVPPLETNHPSEQRHFMFIQIASVILGIYILFYTIVDYLLPLSDAVISVLVGVMILLLFAPLAIPIKMTLFPSRTEDNNTEENEPLLAASSSSNDPGDAQENDEGFDLNALLAEEESGTRRRRPRRGENFEFHQALIKADFWLLFMAYFLGVGSGVTVLNNLAQIGVAAGLEDTTLLLCIFSFCNFVGRIGGGSASEYLARSRLVSRTIWMTATQAIMVIAFLLYASDINGTLYVSTGMLGVGYGVQFSVMLPTVSEIFGLKHFGLLYNFMLLGNPLGAFLFSGLLAGYLYDKEAAKQLPDSSTCLGPNCFRSTFLFLAGMCTLGSLLSSILSTRLTSVYQNLYAAGSPRTPRAPLR